MVELARGAKAKSFKVETDPRSVHAMADATLPSLNALAEPESNPGRHEVAFSECTRSSACSLLDIVPGIFVSVPVPLHRSAPPKQQGIPRLQPPHLLPVDLLLSIRSDRSRSYAAGMGLGRVCFDCCEATTKVVSQMQRLQTPEGSSL